MKKLEIYQSHKKVGAGKIVGMSTSKENSWTLEIDGGLEVIVDKKYMDKHSPYVGGYLVRYEDGYESFSPVEAFENGYVKEGDNVTDFIKFISQEHSGSLKPKCQFQLHVGSVFGSSTTREFYIRSKDTGNMAGFRIDYHEHDKTVRSIKKFDFIKAEDDRMPDIWK